jgi:hypothetical protein
VWDMKNHVMASPTRRLAVLVAVAAATWFTSMPSEAATPRAGNQCKRRDEGRTVGALVCGRAASGKLVWSRSMEGAASNDCDPNYSPCVPIASDVDCASGSGNGPAYVRGPVRVIGVDIYDLDRNGDGIGCEKG